MRLRVLVAALVATVALALSGCTGSLPTQTSSPLGGGPSAAVARFYDQALVWKGCGGGLQCATATAPLNWAKPGGATIRLALIRKPATGTALGSLFLNPGGPGESGIDYMRADLVGADATLQKHYDLVSWDPRGVGSSSAVTCFGDKQLDRFLYGITPGVIGSARWIAAERKSYRDLGEACRKHTGALLGHVDTASTARDLDMLRADVGDATLNYLGFSYGTALGATYAQLFPKNVGRMVLDGVVDPALSFDAVTEEQLQGFQGDLKDYLRWCLAKDAHCAFTGSVSTALARIGATIAKVAAHPLRNSDGRRLGGLTLVTAILYPLYDTSLWPQLDTLFRDVWKGSAAQAFTLADQYNDRNRDGSYSNNTLLAYQAVDCLDYRMDDSLAAMRSEAGTLDKISPELGPYFGYGELSCADWPYRPNHPLAPVTAKGSAPILVVGTTGDPVTPYRNAVHLAEHELANGHLVTWHGDGHTAYGRSNACVQNTVDDYLVAGTVPKKDPEC